MNEPGQSINLLLEPQSWLDSRTVLDPRVLTIWKKVKRRLRAAHISFEPIDGLALNLYQAGRPHLRCRCSRAAFEMARSRHSGSATHHRQRMHGPARRTRTRRPAPKPGGSFY